MPTSGTNEEKGEHEGIPSFTVCLPETCLPETCHLGNLILRQALPQQAPTAPNGKWVSSGRARTEHLQLAPPYPDAIG